MWWSPRDPTWRALAYRRTGGGLVWRRPTGLSPRRPLPRPMASASAPPPGALPRNLEWDRQPLSSTRDQNPGERFRFGAFEFPPAERLPLHREPPIALGSRAMDLLLCLLESDGEVVSADHLLDHVWRGVNVEAAALRVQVSALRKVLEAADPGADYIVNVAGRGYSLVAPIARDAGLAGPEHAVRPALPPLLARMVGRQADVDALAAAILAQRLVTLVGPGGIGKTTIAVAVAHRLAPAFDGDVAFVDLSTERRPADVASAVATVLQLTALGGD